MNKIILTRGIQGSGKSTWAKAWVAEDPEHRIRINNDDITAMLGQPFGTYGLYERLKYIRRKSIEYAMNEGLDIVVDNMNLSKSSNSEIQEIINNNNKGYKLCSPSNPFEYTMEYKDFFDVPLEVCIERDSKRPNPIGESIIRKTYKQYRQFIAQELNKAEVAKHIPLDKNLKDCVIVDMDATICLNTSGRPFYGPGCAEGIKDDIPVENLIHILDLLSSVEEGAPEIFIVTGRDESTRTATTDWLSKHTYFPFTLYMRKEGDYRKGDIVKKEIYENHIKGKYNVLCVLEDSQKCVDMWRNEGLICLQPNKGVL